MHYGFAQNEPGSGINLSDYLLLRIFLISFWTAYQHEILSRHLVPILRYPPKPPSRAEMDDRPAWEDSGGVYRKMVMVNVYGKHGRIEDSGPAGPGWHWSGYRA